MSIVKELKSAEVKAAALAAELATANEARAQAEQAAAQFGQQLTDAAAAHDAAVAALSAQIEAGKVEADGLRAEIARLTAEAEAVSKAAEQLKAALANDPAYAQAAAAGVAPIESKPSTDSDIVAEWGAIEDPKAKRAFYLANKDKIIAAMKR